MNYPDFSNYGYQITSELGHNRAGGRVTYLATEINTDNKVVIKQFQFARTGASWREYETYEKEIDILKRLHHPQIPRYLDSFPTPRGFCMIQEYKNARSLAEYHAYSPQEVKQIALATLEILIFLQNQIPPIIHRDLKPENILVDNSLGVSLVDFGFARLGGGEIAVSSVVKGTLGFMAPEQMFNRQLTPASDLYSLGMTLIALLTQTPSTEISNLIGQDGKIIFADKLSHLSQEWLNWLEKMVEPHSKNRFPYGQAALDALTPLPVLAPLPTTSTKRGKKVSLISGLGGGIVIASLAWGIANYLKTSRLINPVITDNPSSLVSLREIPRHRQPIYFALPLAQAKIESSPLTTCQLYDSQHRLAAVGNSTLKMSGNKIMAWCRYNFLPEDPTGKWELRFYSADKLLAQKNFTVTVGYE